MLILEGMHDSSKSPLYNAEILMFVGPCIIVITNKMPLVTLLYFL